MFHHNFLKEKDLFCVLPAISYFFNSLKKLLPNAKIYCLINTELKEEISNCMLEVCKNLEIAPITFEKIDKNSGHPTIKGMNDIKEKVLETIK